MNFTYERIGNMQGFGLSIETILKNRGIENVREFLNPSENNLEDESLFDNINVAANELLKSVQNNERITIVVDCDQDGMSSGSMMYQYIQVLINHFNSKSKLFFIVHDDKKHGLDEITLKNVLEQNPNLIIIPDASSNDYKQHQLLHDKNIKIIVLDHHECEKYSEYAIVVNNQLSKKIKNKSMTGAGIVYKFIKYIDKLLNIKTADDYLDLLALGMIADTCDLRDLESRYLTLKGLNQIEKQINKNKLITEMVKKKSYELKNKITILGVAFYLAPLVNAIIRNGTLNEKKLMFKAFINSNERYIDKIRGRGEVELSIQEYIVRIAEKCKRKQDKLIQEGIEYLTEQINMYNLNKNAILIVNGTNEINENYTGLIANKLASFYHKPCLVIRGKNEILNGSGRGFDKSKIKDFKKWCNDTNLFELAEGHANAFGIRIKESNINKLYEIVSKLDYTDELIYQVDGIFTEKTLNKYIIENIAKHNDIWGTTVQEPKFAIDDLTINTNDIYLIGEKKTTIKFKYKDITFIKFKSNENEFNNMKKYKAINLTLIGRFELNTYNGVTTPQINIEAMKFKEGKVKFVF